MKVVIIGNQARALANFWSVLAFQIGAAGHDLIFFLPPSLPDEDPVWEERLKSSGAELRYYRLDRKGLNPFKDLATLRDFYSFFKDEKPDIIFASTIKPVIYGSLASFFAKSPNKKNRFLMITGLGYMFEADSLMKKMLRTLACFLYRAAFSCSGKVYFQNMDDRKLFEDFFIIPRSIEVGMTPGTGVDLERFQYAPIEGEIEGEKLKFLLVGRLLEAKGIEEYCLAAEIMKKKYPDLQFNLLGPEEKGLGAYPMMKVRDWDKRGIIRYLGETKDVRPYLKENHIIVLPSWREGLPTSLLEAMATGRALLATDVPGCREVVKNSENGYLLAVKDPAALAGAMERFVRSPENIKKMGAKGRQMVEEKFSALQVADNLMKDFGLLRGKE